MSRIYFHSPSGDVALAGAERAHMGSLVNHMALGLLDPFHNHDTLIELMEEGHYLAQKSARYHPGLADWVVDYGTSFRTDFGLGSSLMTWRGHELSPWRMALNTAMRVGSDPIKLAARLHGQCEIHCWVDGPNRAWLADIMQRGLDAKVFRTALRPGYDIGWERLIAFLRQRDDEPVVASYSVCDGFPEPYDAEWEGKSAGGDGDELWEEWGRLTAEQQWEAGMSYLRAREDSDSWREIKPDNWEGFYFGEGLSVLDLTASDWRHRLNQALELDPAVDLVKR